MGNREEALHRIFDATGVSRRLTDDQKRELLAHLEDAVQHKVEAGISEMDAVGQAFVELGPLKNIVDRYPAEAAAVTPEGGLLATWSRRAALKGLALLGILAFFQTFLTPKFQHFFAETGTVVPSLTLLFMEMRHGEVLIVPALLLISVAVLQVVARRRKWTRKAVLGLQISALALYGAMAFVSAVLVVGGGMGVAQLFGRLLG
jgi:hypothetical protein